VRVHLSLPDGYRVREVEGRLYLFDPLGILLNGPKDPSLIEAYAWRHAWRQVAHELNEELADVHAGVRSLESSRRLRQYMRMLDAARQLPREVEARQVRRRVIAWGTFAAAAAAIAIFLMIPTPPPQSTSYKETSSQPARTMAEKRTAPASPAEPRVSRGQRVEPAARPLEMSRHPGRPSRPGPQGPAIGETAVSFGRFVNRTAAEAMMHVIRSKGYIVYVAHSGGDFWVVTRPYRTRAQAERLVGALQEIRLPAQLATTPEI
jgi:cell division septation protein DedD